MSTSAGIGLDRAGAHVGDSGSQAFAERFGFVEIDRQVEQVCALARRAGARHRSRRVSTW